MATTNFVRTWKDGDRLFVNVNGATIEAVSFTLEEGIVTLRFNACVAPLTNDGGLAESGNAIAPDEAERRLSRAAR
jgi:hypothetical protein